MVAKITFPKLVNRALNYNEQKVQKGIAECIGAGNILQDPGKMSFYSKLAVFEKRHMLNDRARTRTLHVSLNYSPTERLTREQLLAVAESYMEKIGFGEQPYFVYQHLDAGHPHLHIVSTTIQPDGSRISTHNIGSNLSEKARKAVEREFGLARAEQQNHSPVIKPVDVAKVIYGKGETKRSISNVLNAVINSYNYTALAELNAILRQYNVLADRGEVEGRMYKHGGLVYRVLDNTGNKIGVPIKASSLNGKPTLARLEIMFEANKGEREVFKQLLKKVVDEVLQDSPAGIKELIDLLAKKNVFTLLRQNEEGRIYGITFVDNQNRTVFKGSDVGKAYCIAALQSHFSKMRQTAAKQMEQYAVEKNNEQAASCQEQKQPVLRENKSIQNNSLLQQLITPEPIDENAPMVMLKKKRKRKKKRN